MPIIFWVILAFVYSTSLSNIAVQNVRLNCPLPINSGIASNVNVNSDGSNITYTVTWDNSTSEYHQTVFKCGEGGTVNIYTVVYTKANNWWDATINQLGYIYNTITTIGDKLPALGMLIYLYAQAPAIVTGLSFYSYINGIFIAFISLGLFLMVRGG